jgi:long-chain acyl-CoA synthetase
MNFLENIFANLASAGAEPVLRQFEDERMVSDTGGEVLKLVRIARAFLANAGVQRGDRVAILANNSIRWAALDLALMAHGQIVVPLYARQASRELVGMMKDCEPALVICGNAQLRDGIAAEWAEHPPLVLMEAVFPRSAEQFPGDGPVALADEDAVTIIYTSGTSGEPKGVVLNVGNINHMLRCTRERLDELMGERQRRDQVFHYLPFCFAGSWIMLLTCLSGPATLTISADLSKLAQELAAAAPDYFLNVPTLLERVRTGTLEQIRKKGGLAELLFTRGERVFQAERERKVGFMDPLWRAAAEPLVFRKIREKIGPNLKAIICGSAPLAVETQLFFMMLGIPVLQVYGLTETTAICTMDDPRRVEPGKVGPAISGLEMRLGDNAEILARGPNIFAGYWKRPEATEQALRDGWFHTGDQGEVDASGNWKITGRIKNLIILNSGHNVAPEPLEERLLRLIAGAQQVVLVGNGRGYLTAIVTGKVSAQQVESALAALNPQLPHYRQVHGFYIYPEPFSVENGLLTANGKLKRDAITAEFQTQIEELYAQPT